MAPFTAWLPARPEQDLDLIVTVVWSGAPGLADAIAPLVQGLTNRGLHVISQTGGLNGARHHPIFQLRLGSRPFYSLGHGCDVLVYLDDDIPDFRRFSLQPGSVLLWEPPIQPRLMPLIPEGVIVYPLPLLELCGRDDKPSCAKGLVAMGALMELLKVSDELLPCHRASGADRTRFDAGVEFARTCLVKRDLYSLPVIRGSSTRMIFTTQQAVKLGLTMRHCDCGPACGREFDSSPMQWVADHLAAADKMVSLLHSQKYPESHVYRSPQGRLFALLGGDESAFSSCVGASPTSTVVVAADVPDVLRLLAAGHCLNRENPATLMGVLVENDLAVRHQSVELDTLGTVVNLQETSPPRPNEPTGSPWRSILLTERDGPPDADVGYVAWGTAQGVVRDAVALCRSFGLNVAALYPKVTLPFPIDELESFARTVKRVVVVESDRTGGYAERIIRSCSFRPAVVLPAPGTVLTPMDIFLREGLGA